MKGSGSKRVVKWDSDGRNVRPGPGTIEIIAFIAIIVIFLIIAIIDFRQVQDIMNRSEKRQGHICFLTRLVDSAFLYQSHVYARYYASD